MKNDIYWYLYNLIWLFVIYFLYRFVCEYGDFNNESEG